MAWTTKEILDMLRRAQELGALGPDAGTDSAAEPVNQPHHDPGPEV